MVRGLTEHGSDLGAPCVVERTFGWLHHFQRLLGRVTTGAPRSMKLSSHSAADEAGCRTDRWQEAGSRRESAFGGTAAIEKRQPCRGHALYSSAVLLPGLLLGMPPGR